MPNPAARRSLLWSLLAALCSPLVARLWAASPAIQPIANPAVTTEPGEVTLSYDSDNESGNRTVTYYTYNAQGHLIDKRVSM